MIQRPYRASMMPNMDTEFRGAKPGMIHIMDNAAVYCNKTGCCTDSYSSRMFLLIDFFAGVRPKFDNYIQKKII